MRRLDVLRPTWVESRQAYTPKFWPTVVLVSVTAVSLGLFLRPWWLATAVNIGIGYAVGWTRWKVWRHRHPVLPREALAELWLERQRKAAPWN